MINIINEINNYCKTTIAKIKTYSNLQELIHFQGTILSKKGLINQIAKNLKTLDNENKKIVGIKLNQTKSLILENLNSQKQKILDNVYKDKIKKEVIDLTLPAINFNLGKKNLLTTLLEDISIFFVRHGFEIIESNEIENEDYNFNLLNLPKNHPARENHDTFYVDKNLLLRTHCTNATVKIIESITKKDYLNQKSAISIGNVYRRDTDDATHSHQFIQIDGFVIGPDINFSNLKWIFEQFCIYLFGKETKIRLRPSYFPFTEPSVEIDIACAICVTKGCPICKNSGYIEILGAGMINSKIFTNCKKPSSWQGFAFGIGLERIAMIKYKIDDIRYFYNNDLRFLKQV